MKHEQIAPGATDSFLCRLTDSVATNTRLSVVYVAGALNRDDNGNLTACGADVARAARTELQKGFRR